MFEDCGIAAEDEGSTDTDSFVVLFSSAYACQYADDIENGVKTLDDIRIAIKQKDKACFDLKNGNLVSLDLIKIYPARGTSNKIIVGFFGSVTSETEVMIVFFIELDFIKKIDMSLYVFEISKGNPKNEILSGVFTK